jgi:PadR family transcriptional regulator PadR
MEFQVTASLLDACVLAALVKEPTYGYALTQHLQHALDVSESTLYPVLRRLQKQGLLAVFDQAFNGRNRRYYAITPQGGAVHEANRRDWHAFKQRIDSLLEAVAAPDARNVEPSAAPGVRNVEPSAAPGVRNAGAVAAPGVRNAGAVAATGARIDSPAEKGARP